MEEELITNVKVVNPPEKEVTPYDEYDADDASGLFMTPEELKEDGFEMPTEATEELDDGTA